MPPVVLTARSVILPEAFSVVPLSAIVRSVALPALTVNVGVAIDERVVAPLIATMP